MKKGLNETVILVVFGVLLLIFSVLIFVNGFKFGGSSNTQPAAESTLKTACPNDCIDNLDGSRCLSIYSGGSYSAYCGCHVETQEEDCKSGVCDGIQFKCKN